MADLTAVVEAAQTEIEEDIHFWLDYDSCHKSYQWDGLLQFTGTHSECSYADRDECVKNAVECLAEELELMAEFASEEEE